jgi:DNA uptake protein ComE-like DNA-binding protein
MHCSVLAAALAAATAGCAIDVASADLALTTTDVDVAPECAGILDHANQAPLADLAAVLPPVVADRIVGRRLEAPFVSLADVLTVVDVGPARLDQIAAAARAAGRIDASCAGIIELVALSSDDEAAVVAYIDSADDAELRAALPSDAVVPALLAARPLSSAAAIAAVRGVGPATFRAVRNAAVAAASDGPFELLVAAVNDLDRDVEIRTRFDWRDLVSDDRDAPGRLTSATCFGIDPALLPAGTTIRPELATATEVEDAIADAVGWANRNHELDPTAGLADLAERAAGHTFAGCYVRYEPDPWSGINRQFFIGASTSLQVYSDVRWSE